MARANSDRTGALVLVLGAATWVAGTFAKANLIKQYPSAGQLVDVGGNNMHIYCFGRGSPTVILAAGLDDFSIMWSLVQPEVTKFSRVCAYDRTGLGGSEASSRLRNSATFVKELHTLLVNAKIEPPYMLVGHSFVGALVELYAQAFPDEIVGFEKNLAETRDAHVDLGKLPLIVLSEGAWETFPGVSDAENRQARQTWHAMQSELLALSSNSKQVVAQKSGHFIQLPQPELVIDAIRQVI